jgi:hypothetical protein
MSEFLKNKYFFNEKSPRYILIPEKKSFSKQNVWDGWMSSGWSSTPASGPQDGPNVHHGLFLMSQSFIFVFVLGSRTKQFLCSMYLVKIV